MAAFQAVRHFFREECRREDLTLIGWLFLRIIALIYLAAFSSWGVQVEGLVGADGILPASEYLDRAGAFLESAKFWRVPTLFWLNSSDLALKSACLAGIFASLLVFFDLATRVGLLACYLLYLSLVQVGQEFASFQWDVFLLESGFLSLFLTGGSPLVSWLFRFLLFRFMFMGGVVKLASGDPSWSHLTALHYHFETQPLPSPLAWYAHRLPDITLRFSTAAVLFIELFVPFFVFLGRPFRLFAAAGFILLQGCIMLTGNYNFFNLLTSALCIFLLEDRDVCRLLGNRLSGGIIENSRQPGSLAHLTACLQGGFTLLICFTLIWMTNMHQKPVEPLYGLARLASSLSLVNGYGPFAVMTTERREIVLEGSADGRDWLAYEFKYKPGDLIKPLSWNIPHQPRLDWQMWFAALSDARRNPWYFRLVDKLREGSKPVLSLLKENPFPDHPPNYLRAAFYSYTFTNWEQRSKTGRNWNREFLGYYLSKR